jgi:hypothetical protein
MMVNTTKPRENAAPFALFFDQIHLCEYTIFKLFYDPRLMAGALPCAVHKGKGSRRSCHFRLAQFVVPFPWNRSPPIGRVLQSLENRLNFLEFLHYGNLLPVCHLAIRRVRPMTHLAWLCSPVFRLLRPLPPEPGATGPQDWLVREQYKEPGHLTLIIHITNLQPSINTHPNPNMRHSLLVAIVAAAFCFAFVAAGTCYQPGDCFTLISGPTWS